MISTGASNPAIHSVSTALLTQPEVQWAWKTAAASVGKVGVAVLAFSAVSAGIGGFMQIAGAHLVGIGGTSLLAQTAQNIGKATGHIGDGLFLAGRYAFLSVAVPVYTVTWIVPKWIVKEGIPQVARLAHQYVLVPLYNGIVQGVQYLSEAFIKVTWL